MSDLYLRYKECNIPLLLHTLMCVAAYFFWFIVALVCFPLVVLIQAYNLAEVILVSYLKRGRPVKLEDIPFVLDCNSNPYIIVCMTKLKGDFTTDMLKSLLQERIISKCDKDKSFCRLTQYVSRYGTTFVWYDDPNFSLNTHVIDYPEEIEDSEDIIYRIYSTIAKEKLSPFHGQWRIMVCRTKNKASTYLFSSFHHAVGDGFSLQAMFTSLMDEKPKFIPPRHTQGVIANPYLRILKGVMTGPLAVTAVVLSRFSSIIPFTASDNDMKEDRCVAWFSSTPFEIVRDIKNATDTTVNDVLLAALSGALGRYMGVNSSPQEVPIVISFNSRSYRDLMKSDHPLKNNSGGSFVSLPTSTKNPIDCLMTINRRTKILKSSADGHVFEFIFKKIVGLLPYNLAKWATYSLRRHCSLLVSNVVGPLEPVHINGREVELMVFTPPLMYNLGIAISFFTYSNKISMSILSIKSVLPDPGRLVGMIESEIRLMHQYAIDIRDKKNL